MTKKTQRWTPPCGCSFEQIYDLEDPDSTTKVFFTHNVCSQHEPLVRNKPNHPDNILVKKRKDVFDTVQGLMKANRDRNLNDYDNNKEIKNKRAQIKNLKAIAQWEGRALGMESMMDNERDQIVRQLDDFENRIIDTALMAIHGPYAFIGDELYNTVREELKNGNQ